MIHNSSEVFFKWPPKNVLITSWYTASCEIHKRAQTASGNFRGPEIKIWESTRCMYNREFDISQRTYRSLEASDYLWIWCYAIYEFSHTDLQTLPLSCSGGFPLFLPLYQACCEITSWGAGELGVGSRIDIQVNQGKSSKHNHLQYFKWTRFKLQFQGERSLCQTLSRRDIWSPMLFPFPRFRTYIIFSSTPL